MYLWTDFEGATIDSAFALTKLLQTEGRSAFFSTVNASGEPVLIRIIECHFDEDEILARWRGVQALGHPSFLRIDRFGQFLVEGDDHITSVYAVFERVEANLGEVLKRGRLSAPDAAQIGLSVASALESLHANGFVHEHIEAGNIYAVGNTVKLRSDCIRGAADRGSARRVRRCVGASAAFAAGPVQ
jgi:serine/threonine protein kinase